MPLFGKGKSKNPPPPPPKPDYTPQNVDPDENPLYQPPELLQSYLEPPVTQQSVRHSASDIHSNFAPPPLNHHLKSSESCSFIENNLSYEVDGNLVKQLQNPCLSTSPAVNGRPRSGGATSYLDSSHALLQQRLSGGNTNNANNNNQSTISVKANDSFIFDGFHAYPSQRQPQQKPCPPSHPMPSAQHCVSNGQIKTASSLHSQLDQLTQLHLQHQQINLPTSSVQAQIQQLQQLQLQQNRPTLDANYSDPKDACQLRDMAPNAHGPLSHSLSYPLQMGGGAGPKFLMDSSGMFRGGPEGLTVSDPESGVFSTHELENMGCDDEDDEYSKPYEPQILRDFLRKVQRDDEIELASASASVTASNVTTPQSPPPVASPFLVAPPRASADASANSVVEDPENTSVYCDPAAAFGNPPGYHHGHGTPSANAAANPAAPSFVAKPSASNGFVNPLHHNFSAYQSPNGLSAAGGTGGGSSVATEQHHFDPKALGIRPREERDGKAPPGSPHCTCDEGSVSSSGSPIPGAPTVSPATFHPSIDHSRVNSSNPTLTPSSPSTAAVAVGVAVSASRLSPTLADYEQAWDIRLSARDPVGVMSAAIDNLNNAEAVSAKTSSSNDSTFINAVNVEESASSTRGATCRDKPTPAPRFSILANPEVEAIKGSAGAVAGSPASSRYSTPSGDSQAGNQLYEDPWDSGAKQRELEEKFSKRATALASACERVSPSGESETSGHRASTGSEMTDSTVSTGSAFHSPAKFTSAFSSSSSAVTVTAFDARFSPPPITTHADPFVNASSPVLAPHIHEFGSNQLVVPSKQPTKATGSEIPGIGHDLHSYQTPKPIQNPSVITNLPIFYPNSSTHACSSASTPTDGSANYQTPRIPASRSAQSHLTLLTQIPLLDSDKSRATEVVTHAEIHRDDVHEPHTRSPPIQNAKNGFPNPLFNPNNNNNNHPNSNGKHMSDGKNNHPSSPDFGRAGFNSTGALSSPVGASASPKIPSAPMEDKLPDGASSVKFENSGSAKPSPATRSPRKPPNLHLDLGCSALNAKGERVDATLPLRQQPWFHGSISRTEAERLLSSHKEGSYLVRQSESKKEDYSLSLRSAKGFMHMKIVRQNDKYILGQFSQPYASIPEMIHHYAKNKLPIKGATHMSLLYPVKDELL